MDKISRFKLMNKNGRDKTKSRKALFQQTLESVKEEDLTSAEETYREFCEIAPTDSDRFVLRYLLDKAEKKPLEDQMRSLLRLKEIEYTEEWAYELAKIYHKLGRDEDCVRECKDIVLWFGSGEIVEKAKMLGSLHGDGTALQAVSPAAIEKLYYSIHPEKSEEAEYAKGEEPEQLELDLSIDGEEDESEQLEFELEIPESPSAGESSIEETQTEEEPEDAETDGSEENEYAEEPKELKFWENKTSAEEANEIDYVPDDALTALAIEQLREEDYIITEENVQMLQLISDEIRSDYREEDGPLQMTQRVREIVDRAEKRSMKTLLSIVNSCEYSKAEFLILKREDFAENAD